MQPQQFCVSYVLSMLPIFLSPPLLLHVVVVVFDSVSMALASVEIMPYVSNDDHP